MNGLMHIEHAFKTARSQGRAALMPYFTLGFPSSNESLSIIETISKSGADLIELGIPFSDPLADGPTIQHSTQVALENGITVSRSLELVTGLRSRLAETGANLEDQPALLIMSYINPLLAYGVDRFVTDAVAAGADGMIVPDLPLEEAENVETISRLHQFALVFMVAPTSPAERIRLAASRSTGFLYLVSLTGVTGARQTLSPSLANFVQDVRSMASLPVAVGFGISTPEQAHSVGACADGVIIGSALINAVEKSQDACQAAANFVHSIYNSLSQE